MKLLSALAVSTMLFAGNGFTKELSYDQFKQSCENPADFGHQRPPQEIRLMCRDLFTGWKAVESGTVKLSESRLVTGELFSDKYHVNTSDFDIKVPERNTLCPRFREVLETAAVEVNLTCDQVLTNEKTLKEMCQEALDELIAGNPDAVESKPTGRTFSPCSDVSQKP